MRLVVKFLAMLLLFALIQTPISVEHRAAAVRKESMRSYDEMVRIWRQRFPDRPVPKNAIILIHETR